MGAITPTDYRVEHLEFTQPFMDLPTNYIIPAPDPYFNPASIFNPLQLSVLIFRNYNITLMYFKILFF